MGLEDISLEKVDVVVDVAAIGLGGGRTGGAVLALGVRDCPEWRVSGDWVRRGMDFVDVSAATSGFVFGGGADAGAVVGDVTDAARIVSVALGLGTDGTLSFDVVFHGDDDLASLFDFSQAVLASEVSAALPACSAWICCCLLRSFCDILVGC